MQSEALRLNSLTKSIVHDLRDLSVDRRCVPELLVWLSLTAWIRGISSIDQLAIR